MDGKVVTLVKTLRMGVPVELASDGGLSFTAYDFDRF